MSSVITRDVVLFDSTKQNSTVLHSKLCIDKICLKNNLALGGVDFTVSYIKELDLPEYTFRVHNIQSDFCHIANNLFYAPKYFEQCLKSANSEVSANLLKSLRSTPYIMYSHVVEEPNFMGYMWKTERDKNDRSCPMYADDVQLSPPSMPTGAWCPDLLGHIVRLWGQYLPILEEEFRDSIIHRNIKGIMISNTMCLHFNKGWKRLLPTHDKHKTFVQQGTNEFVAPSSHNIGDLWSCHTTDNTIQIGLVIAKNEKCVLVERTRFTKETKTYNNISVFVKTTWRSLYAPSYFIAYVNERKEVISVPYSSQTRHMIAMPPSQAPFQLKNIEEVPLRKDGENFISTDDQVQIVSQYHFVGNITVVSLKHKILKTSKTMYMYTNTDGDLFVLDHTDHRVESALNQLELLDKLMQ